jgi:hypothetical protein
LLKLLDSFTWDLGLLWCKLLLEVLQFSSGLLKLELKSILCLIHALELILCLFHLFGKLGNLCLEKLFLLCLACSALLKVSQLPLKLLDLSSNFLGLLVTFFRLGLQSCYLLLKYSLALLWTLPTIDIVLFHDFESALQVSHIKLLLFLLSSGNIKAIELHLNFLEARIQLGALRIKLLIHMDVLKKLAAFLPETAL